MLEKIIISLFFKLLLVISVGETLCDSRFTLVAFSNNPRYRLRNKTMTSPGLTTLHQSFLLKNTHGNLETSKYWEMGASLFCSAIQHIINNVTNPSLQEWWKIFKEYIKGIIYASIMLGALHKLLWFSQNNPGKDCVPILQRRKQSHREVNLLLWCGYSCAVWILPMAAISATATTLKLWI